MFKKAGKIVAGAVAGVAVAAGNAMAALDLTGVTVDTASAEAMAGIVIAGCAALWGIRKVIKTVNKS